MNANDGLPDSLCVKCLEEIKRIDEFVQVCKETENTLKQCLKANKVIDEDSVKQLEEEDVFEEDAYQNDNEVGDSLFEVHPRKKVCRTNKVAVIRGVKRKKIYQKHSKSPDENDSGPFQCEKCDKKFNMKRNLRQHELTHGEKKYLCNYCGKSYMMMANLLQHERIHTGERPYPCSECGKSFARITNLKQHLLTHTGVKPFQCDVCLRRFTQMPHLIVHRRTHTGHRPHKCNVCLNAFTTPAGLRKHMLTHTGEKPHHCQLCNRKFSHIDTLRRHNKVAHEKEKNDHAPG